MLGPLHALPATGKPSTPEQKKLMGACKDFESVMLGMVFKQMGAANGKDDPLSKGAGADTWRDMLADERAKEMTKSGGLGLADGIYHQLANRV
ncbi:MAG: flagellar biosynthesis protein FlgJ [Cyanobacteria bacterium RYN_339]|nr:flagellar biosynthesis protein FlgJ [Cyanobacteria bacterium RYN_339]